MQWMKSGEMFMRLYLLYAFYGAYSLYSYQLNFAISDSKALTATRQNEFELIDYITRKIKTAL